MPQHFLLSAKARTLSIGAVTRMSDEQVEATFKAIRWADTNGAPVCPHCECPKVYEARRPSGQLRFRCKACRGDFSLTSGTCSLSTRCPCANISRPS
jgi:transposase-like protein